MAGVEPCYSSIRCGTLDGFVGSRLLDALSPAGVQLSLRVIEDEQTRREQLDTLHIHRVAQARYEVEEAQRRYRHVDPANRLVAAQLERQWETALSELDLATSKLDELRATTPVKLRDSERDCLLAACTDVSALWRSGASLQERKQIARVLLQRVEVDVQNNSERVYVRLHWSGGFESVHQITRTVQEFDQLECYETLIDRVLELTIAGVHAREVAAILEREGYRSPRHDKPISEMMVKKLTLGHPRCHKQLTDPVLEADQWRSAELARTLGIPEKRLKHWVTRGWATAIQRPHGRVWVIYADQREVERLQALARSQTGQGRPKPPKELWAPLPIPRTN
jgi:hypothetical protein